MDDTHAAAQVPRQRRSGDGAPGSGVGRGSTAAAVTAAVASAITRATTMCVASLCQSWARWHLSQPGKFHSDQIRKKGIKGFDPRRKGWEGNWRRLWEEKMNENKNKRYSIWDTNGKHDQSTLEYGNRKENSNLVAEQGPHGQWCVLAF